MIVGTASYQAARSKKNNKKIFLSFIKEFLSIEKLPGKNIDPPVSNFNSTAKNKIYRCIKRGEF